MKLLYYNKFSSEVGMVVPSEKSGIVSARGGRYQHGFHRTRTDISSLKGRVRIKVKPKIDRLSNSKSRGHGSLHYVCLCY
jgi:hypothetical protein